MSVMKLCSTALAVVLGIVAVGANAQSWPARPVQLIIPFTPGSSTDIIGRAVAAKLSALWGQPVLADNRVGAGGSVGSAIVATAAPDGHTLLVNSSAHASNPSIYANLPYDTLKDFVDIAPLGGGPNILMVGVQTGWRSFEDFMAAAKESPGSLHFASAGFGSGTHFNLEKLKLMAGIEVTHVPYKGTPEAVSDTIAGRVCCYFAPLNAGLAHVKGGKALALAVSSAQRSSLLPEVPTIAESGVPGFEYTLWVGLWGPAGMPAALVARINRDVNRALQSPDLSEQLTILGTEPMHMTPAEFTQFVHRELKDAAKLLQAAGITPQ
jgi:tripartite-type tricarboxylate transporter receptor subunit TctC